MEGILTMLLIWGLSALLSGVAKNKRAQGKTHRPMAPTPQRAPRPTAYAAPDRPRPVAKAATPTAPAPAQAAWEMSMAQGACDTHGDATYTTLNRTFTTLAPTEYQQAHSTLSTEYWAGQDQAMDNYFSHEGYCGTDTMAAYDLPPEGGESNAAARGVIPGLGISLTGKALLSGVILSEILTPRANGGRH